jgi:hypothetical protein
MGSLRLSFNHGVHRVLRVRLFDLKIEGSFKLRVLRELRG